ncbi:hypothetical protein TNCV_1743961 [Trichonephila clavipes]|nr:hypothetical protein TNCV_1743961 [Trichonephila clavipes]
MMGFRPLKNSCVHHCPMWLRDSLFHGEPKEDSNSLVIPESVSGTFQLTYLVLPQYGFVEWAKNEIVVVPDFHKRILFSDEAHFWLNGYVNKQNCRIWSEANPQVYVETPLHPEKLTVWCALWAGGILLQKR